MDASPLVPRPDLWCGIGIPGVARMQYVRRPPPAGRKQGRGAPKPPPAPVDERGTRRDRASGRAAGSGSAGATLVGKSSRDRPGGSSGPSGLEAGEAERGEVEVGTGVREDVGEKGA